ncbi:K+-H+ exchange-like protein [Melia azedarach]|uniref:K+-H+ exchange-like protein n=1 Tax=Melia azedarach TaxID=155640 RepID=A0ACC1Y1U9_MELAZ|nr:K+-H+ exchange-like protein [Melia azedarach]
MRARLVVFPVKGRNWCFSRSVEPLVTGTASSSHTPTTLKQLWHKFTSSNQHNSNNLELIVDFISHKMNNAWINMEKAPHGSLKNKIHGLGLKLLAREKPSEMFLKSISKEVTHLQVIYPSSLNARLVRRRLRHVAMRGTIIHKKYLYGSVSLLPFTFAFSVLPLPNIPFFWILYRTYSHWRALQGSEKLLKLVSDQSQTQNSAVSDVKGSEAEQKNSEQETSNLQVSQWVLLPSAELEKLVRHGDKDDGLSKCGVSDICAIFKLNNIHVLKYRDSV